MSTIGGDTAPDPLDTNDAVDAASFNDTNNSNANDGPASLTTTGEVEHVFDMKPAASSSNTGGDLSSSSISTLPLPKKDGSGPAVLSEPIRELLSIAAIGAYGSVSGRVKKSAQVEAECKVDSGKSGSRIVAGNPSMKRAGARGRRRTPFTSLDNVQDIQVDDPFRFQCTNDRDDDGTVILSTPWKENDTLVEFQTRLCSLSIPDCASLTQLAPSHIRDLAQYLQMKESFPKHWCDCLDLLDRKVTVDDEEDRVTFVDSVFAKAKRESDLVPIELLFRHVHHMSGTPQMARQLMSCAFNVTVSSVEERKSIIFDIIKRTSYDPKVLSQDGWSVNSTDAVGANFIGRLIAWGGSKAVVIAHLYDDDDGDIYKAMYTDDLVAFDLDKEEIAQAVKDYDAYLGSGPSDEDGDDDGSDAFNGDPADDNDNSSSSSSTIGEMDVDDDSVVRSGSNFGSDIAKGKRGGSSGATNKVAAAASMDSSDDDYENDKKSRRSGQLKTVGLYSDDEEEDNEEEDTSDDDDFALIGARSRKRAARSSSEGDVQESASVDATSQLKPLVDMKPRNSEWSHKDCWKLSKLCLPYHREGKAIPWVSTIMKHFSQRTRKSVVEKWHGCVKEESSTADGILALRLLASIDDVYAHDNMIYFTKMRMLKRPKTEIDAAVREAESLLNEPMLITVVTIDLARNIILDCLGENKVVFNRRTTSDGCRVHNAYGLMGVNALRKHVVQYFLDLSMKRLATALPNRGRTKHDLISRLLVMEGVRSQSSTPGAFKFGETNTGNDSDEGCGETAASTHSDNYLSRFDLPEGDVNRGLGIVKRAISDSKSNIVGVFLDNLCAIVPEEYEFDLTHVRVIATLMFDWLLQHCPQPAIEPESRLDIPEDAIVACVMARMSQDMGEDRNEMDFATQEKHAKGYVQRHQLSNFASDRRLVFLPTVTITGSGYDVWKSEKYRKILLHAFDLSQPFVVAVSDPTRFGRGNIGSIGAVEILNRQRSRLVSGIASDCGYDTITRISSTLLKFRRSQAARGTGRFGALDSKDVILELNENDQIHGRTSDLLNQMVEQRLVTYVSLAYREKCSYIDSIVAEIESLSPAGRFLEEFKDYDGDGIAYVRVSKSSIHQKIRCLIERKRRKRKAKKGKGSKKKKAEKGKGSKKRKAEKQHDEMPPLGEQHDEMPPLGELGMTAEV